MKIVLTGGPSAGKTSIAEILVREFEHRATLVQEAASLLFRGGFPRYSDSEHKKCQQRAIYYLQQELEHIGALDPQHRNLICDRGSVDSLAYWPTEADSFLESVNSNLDRELERYDWVIHFETGPSFDYQANSLRIETRAEAIAIGERIDKAWSSHPRRLVIPGTIEFVTKVNLAINIVDLIFDGCSFDEIQTAICFKSPNEPLPTFHQCNPEAQV